MTPAGPAIAEFALLVRCCRWNFTTAAGDRPSISSGLDWPLFVDLAEFHRVQGLAWNALAPLAIPATAALRLSAGARLVGATNLVILRECDSLREAFAEYDRPLLFLKGLTVAALAYRSPMLKMGWDIDLLIDPSDLDFAASTLAARGFKRRIPAGDVRLEHWHASNKESVWSKPDQRLHVELHTRLADNPCLIETLSIRSPRQEVEVADGIVMPTLARDQLIAYLAVHGASSAWFRLKWISDFAALLDGFTAEELAVLYRRTQELGAARAMGQALLLADLLFDSLDRVPMLRSALAADYPTRILRDAAMTMLTRRPLEPTERRLGTWPIHWTQFLLKKGTRFKYLELRRQLASSLNRGE